MSKDTTDRFYGAWWGAFLGDAIGMPAHGYLSQKLLQADYGTLSDFAPAKNPHPESVLYTLPQPELPPEFDYLGPKRRELWSRRGTHFHYGLDAGENTLPLYLALHLAASIADAGKFDIENWMGRYEAIMTTPDAHADTFVPSIHRRYFENRAAGKKPEQNGCPDAHMGDVAMFMPLMFAAVANPDKSQMDLYRALKKFTLGESASTSAFFLAEVLANVIKGSSIEDTLYVKMTPDRHFSLAFPLRRWAAKDDSHALSQTGKLAPLEESMPLTMYMAVKYGGDIKKALFGNANIGGESTGRGAMIGMLIGAQTGFSGLPQDLVGRLKYAGEIQALGEMLFQNLKNI